MVTVILGSGIVLLDGTVVNVAAKSLGEDLGASFVEVQWILNGYLLSLASLILVGSSLGDRYGRRRVYLLGVAAFGVSSLLCALAQTPEQLVGFRMLQGVAGALLTPGALALIQGSFRVEDRAAAIGSWAGYAGVAAALGPFLGGFLVENASWRWIFAVNLPLCVAVLWLGRFVPDSRDEEESAPFDILGAVLGTFTLATLTFVLTSWRTLAPALVLGLVVAGLCGLVAFVLAERRPGAMAPAALFGSRIFTAANLMTFLTYGALGVVLFLVVLQLQVSSGYSAVEAGVATLPLTLCMLLFSSRAATLSSRIGPRLPMSLGPVTCAVGVALMAGIDGDAPYLTEVLPGILVFGIGLTLLVAPLTAAVLAAAPDHHAGVASGINNALARTGSLLGVAAVPGLVGLGGSDYQDPAALGDGYFAALMICVGLLLLGGACSWFGLSAPEIGPGSAETTDRNPVDPGTMGP